MTTAAQVQAQINKELGRDVIKLGSQVPQVAHWSTGIFPVDVVFDGGLPTGRFTQIYGDFSTGKSLISYRSLASVQRQGGRVALCDSEHSFDEVWGREQGIDTDDLIVHRPETGEEAIMVMEMLIRNNYDLIVWDSVASTQTKQYAEKAPGEDLQPGGQARMMSAGLRRLTAPNEQTAVLCLNQTRVNVGMTYGPPVSVPGGKALGFYASYILSLNKAGKITRDVKTWNGDEWVTSKEVVGQRIRATMEKWKLNAPTREVFMTYSHEIGQFDETAYLFAWAMETGLIEVSGAWYALDDLKVQGKEKFQEVFAEQKELLEWIKQEIGKDWVMASPQTSRTTPAAAPKKKGGSRKGKS